MGAKPEKIQLPIHLGLIVDGNRRWAKEKGLPGMKGHHKGYEVLRDISISAINAGVKFVSAYCFSVENWNRSKTEVTYLMRLIIKLLEDNLDQIHDNDIKIVHIGSREGLPRRVLDAIDKAVKETASHSRGTLALCINYGGQQEIVDAAKKLLRQKADPRRLTVKDFEAAIYQPDVPALDLVIRTSGEYRTSGYMLWRAAYAEYAFVDKYWPDFTKQDLKLILLHYAKRHRRFGR